MTGAFIPPPFPYSTLHDWQDLAGALLGGLMGVIGALIVSHNDKLRTERMAAFVVISDLVEFRAAGESLAEARKDEDEHSIALDAAYITEVMPYLSPLFEDYMARIAPIDRILAAHLTLFLKMYKTAAQQKSQLASILKPASNKDAIEFALARVKRSQSEAQLQRCFLLAYDHAKCAAELTEKLILQRKWWRIRIRKYEKRCMHLLDHGEPLPEKN